MNPVNIYTDGAAKGNPGPGGYGVVLINNNDPDQRKEMFGGFRHTTNNRMELLAAIEGLNTLKKPCKVNLYSDSEYVVKAFNQGWLENWQKKGWKKSNNKPVMNIDLWRRIIPLINAHDVKFIWVKGHSDNIENVRCDQLATAAAEGDDLGMDVEYEKVSFESKF